MVTLNDLKVNYPHWCNWQPVVDQQTGKTKKVPGFYVRKDFKPIDITRNPGRQFKRVKPQRYGQPDNLLTEPDNLLTVGIILGHPVSDTTQSVSGTSQIGENLSGCNDSENAQTCPNDTISDKCQVKNILHNSDKNLILAGIDLDCCVNDGTIATWAQEIVNAIGGYVEYSPSGNGLHILCIVQSDMVVNTKRGGIELYTNDRYFTVTEQALLDQPLADASAFFRQFSQQNDATGQSQGGAMPSISQTLAPVPVSDDKLNQVAEKVLEAMYRGYNDNTSDRSSNDAYCLTYLLTHGFSREECFWLMQDSRFAFGDKQNERNDGGKYTINTINRVYDKVVGTKQPDQAGKTPFGQWCADNGIDLWYDTWQKLEMVGSEPMDKYHHSAIKLAAFEAGQGSFTKIDLLIDNEIRNNRRNPLKDWFDILVWDGTDHIRALFDTIQTSTPREMALEYLRFWFVNAVAKAYDYPNRQNVVIVLQGNQGTGKSTAIADLTREKWRASLETSEIARADSDTKLTATRKLVIEIGEIQLASRRMDAGAMKDFLTKRSFNTRIKYGRQTDDYTVTASYIATTNDRNFLTDVTGNRRFAVLADTVIDLPAWLAIDKSQVWAQAKAMLDAGLYERLPEQVYTFLNADNRTRVTNVRAELADIIDANFAQCDHKDGLTCGQVLDAINGIEWMLDPSKHSDKLMLSSVLSQGGYTWQQIRLGKRRVKNYDIRLADLD